MAASLASGCACSSEDMLGSSKSRQGGWRHPPPTTTPRCWRRHEGSALLSLLGQLRQGEQRCEGCSPGGPPPCPALLQPGGPPHTPQTGLSSSPESASSLCPSNPAAALPPGSPPDQTLEAVRISRGRWSDCLLLRAQELCCAQSGPPAHLPFPELQALC